MGMSNSRLAFSDCYELMEKALADPKGIRIKFASENDAWLYRLRIHNARAIDRKENRENFEKGHGMHGKSVYDTLICRLRPEDNGGGGWWLRIEKITTEGMVIEPLSEEEISPPALPGPLPVPAIIRVQALPFKRRM